MMSSLGALSTFTVVQYVLVALLFLAPIIKLREMRPFALLGLMVTGSFITPISHGLILIIAALILSNRMKPLYLLGLTAIMLLPPGIKPFAYLLLTILALEEYLAEPLESGHSNFMLTVTFLYFTKPILGGQGLNVVGEYVAILYSLRLIFWANSLESVLKLVGSSLAMIALLSATSTQDLSTLICFQALAMYLLFFGSTLPCSDNLKSLFYHNPQHFFLAIVGILLGPILLVSGLITIYPRFIISLAIALVALVWALNLYFVLGLENTTEIERRSEQVGNPFILSHVIVLIFGSLSFVLLNLSSPALNIAQSFATIGICLGVVGIIYGSLKLWLKDTNKISVPTLKYNEMLKRGQVCAFISSTEETETNFQKEMIQLSFTPVIRLARKSYFSYMIFLFLVIISSIVLLLKELGV